MNEPSETLPPGTEAREGAFVKLAADARQLVFQDARVFKAGNSLAIRIPSAIAKAIDLHDGCAVEMAVGNGLICIRKGPSRKLAELIDRISDENMHGEHFGDLAGNESW